MRTLFAGLLFAAALFADMKTVLLPGKSPLVTIRIVFTTGAASDPADKPGAANLTAMMLAQGGTRSMTFKQISEAMFPMAANISVQVDKEMTTFYGAVHVDNLDEYYNIFRAMLVEPGWREDDFKRIKDNAINYLRVALRGNNDEELAKEVLYNTIYEGTPYGHENYGTVSALEKMTIDDLKSFYRNHYNQRDAIIGLAGGYPKDFPRRVVADIQKLPRAGTFALRLKPPKLIEHNQAVIIEKDTRSVAYSLGYPISVRRGDPDYPALLIAQSYFGQHRLSGRRLYDRMREQRGLNYGDYAYIEYFPQGMFRFEPAPNLARHMQIFQMWIRPVEPPVAHFALRLAMYELDNLVKHGLTQAALDETREFLMKYVNLLMKTKTAELGYKIDSEFYGIPEYGTYLKTALSRVTLAEVNAAIKRRLRADRVVIVAVAKDAETLKKQLTSDDPSPMQYVSPKPKEILEEDKTVERWKLALSPDYIKVVPVDQVFE